MAPSPVDGTRRWKVFYDCGGFEHQFLVRMLVTATETDISALVAEFLTDVTSLFFASTVTAVQEAAKGSNFFFPITADLVGHTWGSGANNLTGNPMQLNFVGRSSTGKRVRLGLFGYKGSFSDWRMTGAESSVIADAVATLNFTTNIFIAIDESVPVWYPYADIGANDYWLKQSRAG